MLQHMAQPHKQRSHSSQHRHNCGMDLSVISYNGHLPFAGTMANGLSGFPEVGL